MRIHIADRVNFQTEKYVKTTLCAGNFLMVGLNCFEPGQEQHVHDHPDQEKFYYVVSGGGDFQVGSATIRAGAGDLVWAAAGVPHGVRNTGEERLVVLMGIAPPPR